MYNKTIIEFGFVISGIIKVSARVISLDLDYSGYHKNLIQLLFIIARYEALAKQDKRGQTLLLM